jgi:hypothetical protein
MNREAAIREDPGSLDRADKAAWREEEGWCSPQEAAGLLALDQAPPRFALVDSEPETIP